MLIDLHCHTIYSGDSTLGPEELIELAIQRGLDGICITEHDSFLASEPAEEIARKLDFPLFRGVEINTNLGHILAFGLIDDSWREIGYYTQVDSVRREVERRGGILIPSHPFRAVGSASVQMHLYSMNFISAMEVMNAENNERENQLAVNAWRTLRIPGTGGSDCHSAGRVGICATYFKNRVATIYELIAEVRAGRVAPAYLDHTGSYKLVDS